MNYTCATIPEIGTWEDTRQGDRQHLRYIRGGKELGTVQELAWGGLVATVRTRDGRRHQRPARDMQQARQFVEDNV